MSGWKIIRWLLSFVGKLRFRMMGAISLGIISNLSVIIISMIGIQTVLAVFNGEAVNGMRALWLMVLCGVVRGVARYCEQYLNHDIAFRLLALIREKIFAVLRKLGPARLTGKQSGDLITAITSDVEALEVFFAHTISPTFIALGTTIVTVAFMASLSPALALVLLLGQVIVGVLLPVRSYQRNQQIGDDYQKAFVNLNQKVMENVASLQDIYQFQLQKEKLQELQSAGAALNKQYKKRLVQSSHLHYLGEFGLLATAIAILLLGSYWQLNPTVVLTGTVLALSSFGPVLALNDLGSALLTTLASGRRLYALTEERPVVVFDGTEELADFTNGKLSDVTFAPGDQPVLEQLSLEIRKGDWIGIGGESGSGKSTLLKLLMRYWDPESGQISLNDQPLPSVQEHSLHELEGLMEQQTFIFETTVRENIRLWNTEISDEQVEQAAQHAEIHSWIMALPEGYGTVIGGLARSLSDGERQRVGIARMMAHDGSLLLLDEPTSNLDYINEKAILTTLSSEIKDKTVLLISHRATTLAIAEHQLMLRKGQLTNTKKK